MLCDVTTMTKCRDLEILANIFEGLVYFGGMTVKEWYDKRATVMYSSRWSSYKTGVENNPL